VRIVIFLTVDPSLPACHRKIAGFPALFGTVAMLKVISGSVLWEHSIVTNDQSTAWKRQYVTICGSTIMEKYPVAIQSW